MDDKTAPIESRDFCVGDVIYSIDVFPSDDQFVTTWRCPLCERREGCSHPTPSHADAIECAEKEVEHHQEFHKEALPADESKTPTDRA